MAQTAAQPDFAQSGNSAVQSPGTASNKNSGPKPKVQTVVTVTGQPLDVSLAPASVSVMDAEQVKNSDALITSDVMRAVPFVNMEQNGAEGSLSSLTIRGGKPSLVLVLIDGISVNDLTNLLGGSFDFSSLLTRDIEQVEVVRGPLSSGYGSEAMSGVINFITKPTHYEPEISAGIETGSFGAAGVNLKTEGSQGRLGYKLSGQFLRMGDQVESDAFSTNTFSTSSDYIRNSKTSMNWTARWFQFQGSSFPPNGGGPELSVLKIPETGNAGNFLAGFHLQHQINEIWIAALDADIFTRGGRSYTPPILDSPNPGPLSQPSDLASTRFTRPRLTLKNTFNPAPKWLAHLNARISDEIGSNDSLLAGAFTSNFSTNRGVTDESGDLEFISRRVSAIAALGIGKTAGFNTQVAPRVGTALTIAKDTQLKASWGQAYRVPDLYALENPTVGNPHLLPEKVNGLDAGLEHRFGSRITLSGTYYYNLFSNLIDFSSTEFRLVNRNRVRTTGVETEALVSLPRGIELKAWGSSLDWTIESSPEPLRDVPDWQAGLSVGGKYRGVRASTATYWVGRRYDFQVPAPSIASVGGYSTTDLVIGYGGWGYAGWRRAELFARVDDVFNRRFHEYLGFPNPGIACRVGVAYRFR